MEQIILTITIIVIAITTLYFVVKFVNSIEPVKKIDNPKVFKNRVLDTLLYLKTYWECNRTDIAHTYGTNYVSGILRSLKAHWVQITEANGKWVLERHPKLGVTAWGYLISNFNNPKRQWIIKEKIEAYN